VDADLNADPGYQNDADPYGSGFTTLLIKISHLKETMVFVAFTEEESFNMVWGWVGGGGGFRGWPNKSQARVRQEEQTV
jgi:hypothetical protein